jgi:Ca2+-binding RTX toxin-like protein
LNGGDGNDLLDGGDGSDTLTGGLGNDSYVVNTTADTVTELAGQGTDTVRSSVSWILGANLENLILAEVGALDGQGNALANRITGNNWNNALDGGAGIDTLAGGAGNDTYTVDDAGDVVTEVAGGGEDHVRSTVAYVLGADLEHLTLLGTSAVNGTGNASANRITGNSAANRLEGFAGNDTLDGGGGNDTLDGGGGNDWLTGGADADLFAYATTGFGMDVITDFNALAEVSHDTLGVSTALAADFATLLSITRQSGSDLTITVNPNDRITLRNVTLAQFTADDVQFF